MSEHVGFWLKISPKDALPGSYEMQTFQYEMDIDDLEFPDGTLLKHKRLVTSFVCQLIVTKNAIAAGAIDNGLAKTRLDTAYALITQLVPENLWNLLKT